MLRWKVVAAGLGLTGLLLVGCATSTEDDVTVNDPSASPAEGPSASSTGPASSSTPPLSRTPPPTLTPPTEPPQTPTDPMPTEWVAGIVTRGGTGPCYGMETDDGKQYALYGTDGVALSRGDTIRVRIAPLRLKIYCGAGQHAQIVKLERLN